MLYGMKCVAAAGSVGRSCCRPDGRKVRALSGCSRGRAEWRRRRREPKVDWFSVATSTMILNDPNTNEPMLHFICHERPKIGFMKKVIECDAFNYFLHETNLIRAGSGAGYLYYRLGLSMD